MQSGESTAVPVSFSKSSAEVCGAWVVAWAGTSRCSVPLLSWVSTSSASTVRGLDTLAGARYSTTEIGGSTEVVGVVLDELDALPVSSTGA